MTVSAADATAALLDAAAGTEAILQHPSVGEHWEHPSALPRMLVADVAGHAFLALRHGVRMLSGEPPAAGAAMTPLAGWYGRTRIDSEEELDLPVHVQIRSDGRHVGARGWANVIDRFEREHTELVRVIADRSAGPIALHTDPVVATPFVDYLASRVIELVVHGDDLAYSVGEASPPYAEATTGFAIESLVSLARARTGDVTVLRALARRSRVTDDGTLRAL